MASTDAYNKAKSIVEKIYRVKGSRNVNQILNGLDEEVNLGEFAFTSEYIEAHWTPEMIQNNPGLVTFNLIMTRDEMIAKYMQMQDPTLNNTFTVGMGWSQKVRDAVETNLTAEEKKLAEAYFEFYEDYYTTANEVYTDLYNVDMPHNSNYSPIRRDLEGDISENVLTFQDAQQYAAVTAQSIKARTTKVSVLIQQQA